MKEYSLVGINGNAFNIMGYIAKSMKEKDLSEKEISAYREKVMSGDYNNLLCASQDIIEKLNDALNVEEVKE